MESKDKRYVAITGIVAGSIILLSLMWCLAWYNYADTKIHVDAGFEIKHTVMGGWVTPGD